MVASLLVVSGLDPSGGAGFLADAAVARLHRLRPVGVVTALTVQTSEGVRAAEPVAAELVGAQLTALLGDVEVAAGVIGMLGDEGVAEAVGEAGSAALYRGDPRRALALLRDHLALVTPNLAEAEALAGFAVADLPSMRRAAQAIAESGVACLVKGGHLGGGAAVDVLAAGGSVVDLTGDRVPGGEDVHGTGGALAAAIACQLAGGAALADAARAAAAFVRARLAEPVRAGRGRPSLL